MKKKNIQDALHIQSMYNLKNKVNEVKYVYFA